MLGYRVRGTLPGEVALRSVEEFRPAILVVERFVRAAQFLDIAMPAALRDRGTTIGRPARVLIVSTHPPAGRPAPTNRYDAYLIKPVDTRRLRH